MINRIVLITTSVCLTLAISSIAQKSQALELRVILDELLKRGLCSVVQANTGGCASNINTTNTTNITDTTSTTDTSTIPTSTPTPQSSTPSKPQNIPTDTNTNNPEFSESSLMYENPNQYLQINDEVNTQSETPEQNW